jgi:hypothetical protein
MAPSTTLPEVKASSAGRRRPPRVATAISSPTGTESTTAVPNASRASCRVAGSRSPITSDTGRPDVIEVPRRPAKSSRR